MPVGRFLGMWGLMAVAMSLNGIGRELGLKHLMDARWAGLISAVIGIILIGVITRWGFRPFASDTLPVAALMRFSVALVLLTVGFETVLGRVVDHKSWAQIGEHYAVWRGEPWPIVLGWLAATPFVWLRDRHPA